MDEHWFGEWVPIWEDKDLVEGRTYLKQWKKYILNKYPDMKQINEDHWIERDIVAWEVCRNAPPKTLALKICLKGEFPKDSELLGSKDLYPRELGK